MKNLLLLFIIPLNLFSQSPSIQWQKCYGSSGYGGSNFIQQTTDGGYILSGNQGSTVDGDVSVNHGLQDSWIVKTNSTGIILWEKSIGGSGDDFGNGIQQTSDGGYIVAGATKSNDGDVTGNHGSDDFMIVKLNSLGVCSMVKNFRGLCF